MKMEIKKITSIEFLNAYKEEKAKWSSKQIKALIDEMGSDFDKCYAILNTGEYLALCVKSYKENDKTKFYIDDYKKGQFVAEKLVESNNFVF